MIGLIELVRGSWLIGCLVYVRMIETEFVRMRDLMNQARGLQNGLELLVIVVIDLVVVVNLLLVPFYWI